MTKTTTIPHVLEQLSVELCSQGVKFDTAVAYGVYVMLDVRYEPASAKYDEPHVVVERVRIDLDDDQKLFTDSGMLVIERATNIFHLLSKSQVAAIEENLLAQMGGNN